MMGLRAPPALLMLAQPTSLPARILQSTNTVHCMHCMLSLASGTPLCYLSDGPGGHYSYDCPGSIELALIDPPQAMLVI